MTDCSSIHGSTTSSSDIISSRGIITNPRIRIIRMIRPNSRKVLFGPDNNSTFGFSIRGGKEFGTGFFVSKVDKGSEADIKGLRIGDQIVRVNGYSVDDAIHREFTQFILSQDRLTLKVRGVGMLPIKEKTIDPLSWHIVTKNSVTFNSLEEMRIPQKDVRIVLKVAPRTKLGLGICKGPEWKPGIFVQFIKDFSVAKDAGLRPGDQILSCNSIDFSDVLFSEAVAVMKSSQILEMIVRVGAGLDLFPGESSGYNSSASSVTGDQSPCWGDLSSKRLSIVREENILDKLGTHSQHWLDQNSLRRRKDYSSVNNENTLRINKNEGNKTIIQLSENGTLINNTLVSNVNKSNCQNETQNFDLNESYNNFSSSSFSNDENIKSNCKSKQVNDTSDDEASNKNEKIADICFVSRQSETKTVIVEVHRSPATEETNKLSASSLSIATKADPSISPPKPPPPMSTFSSSTSNQNDNQEGKFSENKSTGTSSLSSAINEELKKRRERKFFNQETNCHNSDTANEKPNELQSKQYLTKKIGNLPLNSNEQRHSALMDEFKRAHRKMFKNGFQENDTQTQERQAELDKANNISKNDVQKCKNSISQTDNIDCPAPPLLSQFIGVAKLQKTESLLKSQLKAEHNITTPTPDYDSTPTHTLTKNNSNSVNDKEKLNTIGRLATNEIEKANGNVAEMESIESYKLQNPIQTDIKPPASYFAPQNSGPPTMKRINKNIAVTIGEYGGQNLRKEPAKLDFIAKANEINNGNNRNNSQPETNFKDNNFSEKLRNELEKTLSRSNLKKQNDLNSNLNKDLNISNCKVTIPKTQSPNIEKLANILQNNFQPPENKILEQNKNGTFKSANKVTISIPNKQELRLTESLPTPTNGILKASYTKSNKYGEKNITFGN